jgi:dTDP-4-amino-4,6-dideoxygalactose transaminase
LRKFRSREGLALERGKTSLRLRSERQIPLYKVFWDEEDAEAVDRVIRRGAFWAIGSEIEEFERNVAGYIGTKYGVAFNSGTSALHAVLLAHGIKSADEVIVPSFTFIATANAPLFVNARPIFADIDETFGLNPKDVERKISKRTRAIIPIHYGGAPCRIDELQEVAEKRGMLLIEDAAESIGATLNNRKVGSFGDSAMISFCGNKVITTGEGGMILTDSGELVERLRLVRSHGRHETEPYFLTTKTLDYISLGYNWRMPTMSAALGISQMRKLDRVIELRRRNAEILTEGLRGLSGLEVPSTPAGFFNVFQMYTLRVRGGRKVRDSLKDFLKAKGITSKVYFEPVHLTQFYRERFGYVGGELPVTEKLSDEVLTLPLYPTMTREEIDYVAESVNEFYQAERGSSA